MVLDKFYHLKYSDNFLYSHIINIYATIHIYICMCMQNQRHNYKDERHSSLKNIPLTLFERLRVRESWRPNRTAIYWPPAPPDIAVCRSRSPGLLNRGSSLSGTCSHPCIFSPTGLQNSIGGPGAPSAGLWLSLPHLVSNSSDLQLYRGSRGPLLLGGGFLYHTLYPTSLVPNSLTSCLTELYNSSIAPSIFGMACLIVIKRK